MTPKIVKFYGIMPIFYRIYLLFNAFKRIILDNVDILINIQNIRLCVVMSRKFKEVKLSMVVKFNFAGFTLAIYRGHCRRIFINL